MYLEGQKLEIDLQDCGYSRDIGDGINIGHPTLVGSRIEKLFCHPLLERFTIPLPDNAA
jgi:hypothetical protein